MCRGLRTALEKRLHICQETPENLFNAVLFVIGEMRNNTKCPSVGEKTNTCSVFCENEGNGPTYIIKNRNQSVERKIKVQNRIGEHLLKIQKIHKAMLYILFMGTYIL